MSDVAAEQGMRPVGTPGRSWLRLAVVLLTAWILLLTLLVTVTANPVTLNRQQILDSFVVVRARVVDTERGDCTVLQSWPQDHHPGQSIHVRNLTATGARAGEIYLLPLVQALHGDWDVTPSPLPGNQPLIYPDDSKAMGRLQQLLGQP